MVSAQSEARRTVEIFFLNICTTPLLSLLDIEASLSCICNIQDYMYINYYLPTCAVCH